MESREYGISTPGSDGEYGGQVRKEQYSDDRMDGHDLHQSGNGLYFRPSGAIFVSYVKRERRICYQSDHGAACKSNRLLRSTFWKGCGQMERGTSDTGKSRKASVCTGDRRVSGQYRM